MARTESVRTLLILYIFHITIHFHSYIDKRENIKNDTPVTGKRKRDDDVNEEKVEIEIIAAEDEAPKAKKAKATHSWSVFGLLSRIWNRLCGRVPDGIPDETIDSTPVVQKDIEPQVSLVPKSSSAIAAPPSSLSTTTTTTTLIVKTNSTRINSSRRLRAEVSAFRVYLYVTLICWLLGV